jgi:hypothetical protein
MSENCVKIPDAVSDVLELLMKGDSPTQAAFKLGIRREAVYDRVNRFAAKLGLPKGKPLMMHLCYLQGLEDGKRHSIIENNNELHSIE